VAQLVEDRSDYRLRKTHDSIGAVTAGVRHLSRHDDTITAVYNFASCYFDP
jgi:hypothetical protein